MPSKAKNKQKAQPKKLKIRKGDTVRAISGRDKGKEGEVLSADPKKGKVLVHQINVVKKATKAHPQKNPQGGIMEVSAPMDVSNVQLICPRCSKAVRVTFQRDKEGRTSRKCRKCGELIDG